MKADDARHGTIAGYQAHAREHSTLCLRCRNAKNDYAMQRKRRIAANLPPEPEPDSVALTGGRWVPADGIMRWQEDGSERLGANERVQLILSDDEQRQAHARFFVGHRDARTVAGEREYQTARKRAQREAREAMGRRVA